MSRTLVVIAIAAVFVLRSDSRGDGPSQNPKPGTESAAKPRIEVPATPEVTDAQSGYGTAVQHALAEPADFVFVDTPLKDFADFIADHFKISVLLDVKSLSDAGVTADTTITEAVKGVSLRSALHLTLAIHDLACVENSPTVLMITTADVAKSRVVLKVYDVRKFADPVNDVSAEPVTATVASSCHGNIVTFSAAPGSWDGLVQAITATVSPSSWNVNGGPASLSILEGDLIVSESEEVQTQIADLLKALEAARQRDPAALKAGRGTVIPSSSSPSARIEQALDSSLDLDFTDTALKDVVDYLQEKLGIPVQLDVKALTDAGVTSDTTFTFKLKNVTARVGLRDMFEAKDLNFVIEHEVILITTADVGKANTVTFLYPVGDLVGNPDFAGPGKDSYDALTDAITTTVRPSSWADNGGNGSIAPFAACKVLVISEPQDVQREIQELMSSIRLVRKSLPETAAVANSASVLRVYWLPWETAGSVADAKEGQQMVEMVRKLIAPKSWSDPNAYIGFIHGQLVVRQTPDVHRRIEGFIGGLSGVEIRHAAAKTAPAAAPPAVNPPVATPPTVSPPAAAPPSASSAAAPGPH